MSLPLSVSVPASVSVPLLVSVNVPGCVSVFAFALVVSLSALAAPWWALEGMLSLLHPPEGPSLHGWD